MAKLEKEPDMNTVELMEHLSVITEQYGVKFSYKTEGETIVSLLIESNDDPEVDVCINVILMCLTMFAEMAFEGVSNFNDQQTYATRCQQIATVMDTIQNQVSQRYVSALDNAKTRIEVVSKLH